MSTFRSAEPYPVVTSQLHIYVAVYFELIINQGVNIGVVYFHTESSGYKEEAWLELIVSVIMEIQIISFFRPVVLFFIAAHKNLSDARYSSTLHLQGVPRNMTVGK